MYAQVSIGSLDYETRHCSTGDAAGGRLGEGSFPLRPPVSHALRCRLTADGRVQG